MTHANTNTTRQEGRALLLIGALIAAAASGCGDLGELDPAQAEVVRFGSCAEVESHVKAEAMNTAWQSAEAQVQGGIYNPYGYVAAFSPVVGAGGELDHSVTNNQEAGVDEADIFQVDGTHAFALHQGRLVIVAALGQAGSGGFLQVDGAEVVADVQLEGEPIEMFLHGDVVVVLTKVTQRDVALLYGGTTTLPARDSAGSVIQAVVYDVSDRKNPVRVRDVAVEGDYVSSRRVGDQLYLVARAGLGGPQLLPPSGTDDLQAWAREQGARIDSADLDAWLPYAYSRTFEGATPWASATRSGCGNVYTARTASGDDALGIYNFDVTRPESEVETTTFIGDGTLVYASLESIIVAHTNYATTKYDGGDTEEVEATALHRFVFDAQGGTDYSATGLVHGWVLNAFSISEYKGYIRVATQMNRATTGYKPINVFTMPVAPVPLDVQLQEDGTTVESEQRFLRVTGELIDIAHGEDLFAVRFVGDVGYLVTWVEVLGDPLWTVDLSNQDKPEVRGELMVPGFSTYLHPIENGRLLAIGRDTDLDAVKLSLFDVSRLSEPRALQEISVGGSGADSEAITEHRAFRYLADRKLMAVPIDGTTGRELALFTVGERSLTASGHVQHDGAAMRRSYAIGKHLYALSDRGVVIVDLDTLGTRAQVTFL